MEGSGDMMDIDSPVVETTDLKRSPSPIRRRPPTRTSVQLAAEATADDMVSDTGYPCPTVGSWYRRFDGALLVVHAVDPKKCIATCQWFYYDVTISDLERRKDKNKRFGVEPWTRELTFEELSRITPDPNWICTPCTSNHEFAIYKKRRKPLGKKEKTRPPGRNRRPKVLELFSGAGGMTHGFRNAKFDVPWAVEKNNFAVATHRSNFPAMLKYNGIVYSECVNEFISKAKANSSGYPKPEEVDHIHGSPPCQGVSDANRGKAGKNPTDAANNALSFAFIDAILHFEPKTATYENVKGLLKYRGVLNYIIGNLGCLGYQVRLTILNSSDYGDPQRRERVIIFAAKEDVRLPSKPPPTHGKGLMQVQTVRDAFSVLGSAPPSRGGVIGTMTNGCDVFALHNHSAPNTVPNEADKNLIKLNADKPAPTIKTVNCFIHPWQNRLLSVREMACLQSFPLTHVFCGSDVQARKQVGNAVPIRMATCIARSVAKSYGMP